MTEDELRSLVRQAIARVKHAEPANLRPFESPNLSPHASHATFPVTSGAEEAGPCIIEPAVPCNHCGYCKSLGH
jgi:hypothetical protein